MVNTQEDQRMQTAEPPDVKVLLVPAGAHEPRRQPCRHELRRGDMRVVAGRLSAYIIGLKVDKLLGLIIRSGQTQRTGHLRKVAVVGHADKPRQEQLPGQDGGAQQQEERLQPGRPSPVVTASKIHSTVSQIAVTARTDRAPRKTRTCGNRGPSCKARGLRAETGWRQSTPVERVTHRRPESSTADAASLSAKSTR